MAVLQVSRGAIPGTRYELTGDRTQLGRNPECDVVIDHISVSRNHAQITREGEAYLIEDLRSRNGTYVNGQSITERTPLADGDEVEICDIMFRFYHGEPPPLTATELGERATSDRGSAVDNPSLLGPGTILDGRRMEDDSGSSSIVTTLQAGDSIRSLRLGIKPEAKLRAVVSILQLLRRAVTVDEVLDSILDGLFRIFPQAEQGFIMLRDPDRDRLRLEATRVRKVRQAEVSVSMTIVRQALRTGEAILSADAAEDSRFNMSDSLPHLEIRSMMCVPLLGENDERLGVIQIDTKNMAEQFSQDDLDVLLAVATPAGLAVANARFLDMQIETRALARELEFAREIQHGFLITGDPAHSMMEVNKEFTFDRSVFRFITAMVVILDLATGELQVVNAGHSPMLLATADGEVRRVGVTGGGLPIGVQADQVFSVTND